MTTTCVICGSVIEAPVYRSASSESLTSLCTVQQQHTVVYACRSCGHVQTPPLENLDEYYNSTYRILIDSEEEDQLYAMVDGRKVFRAEHQAETLLTKLDLPADARVLDYGAAKGATMRRVMASRPDLAVHFFDVSDMYVDFWRRIVPDSRFATHVIPDTWHAGFDAVCSFFMLEHVERPTEVLAAMRSLLRPGGVLYTIVPNPSVNIADFIVVDHVNHFTGPSLERALLRAGFTAIELDDQAHDGAWLVVARRPEADGAAEVPTGDPHLAVDRAHELATYWSNLRDTISTAEDEVAGRPAAVYGAGFYGSFIRTSLRHPEAVVAYVDQNPYLQGGTHFDRPIVDPADLDPAVEEIYVGLNPHVARGVIETIPAWRDRPLRFHYL